MRINLNNVFFKKNTQIEKIEIHAVNDQYYNILQYRSISRRFTNKIIQMKTIINSEIKGLVYSLS